MHFHCRSAHSRNMLKPELFKSTILTPTFSYKEKRRWQKGQLVAGAGGGQSVLPPLAGAQSGQLPAAPASPGRAPRPSLAELSSSPYEARGRQKGWLSNPRFASTCASSQRADKRERGTSENKRRREKSPSLQDVIGLVFIRGGQSVTSNRQTPGCSWLNTKTSGCLQQACGSQGHRHESPSWVQSPCQWVLGGTSPSSTARAMDVPSKPLSEGLPQPDTGICPKATGNVTIWAPKQN